jgi:hypothetical protein
MAFAVPVTGSEIEVEMANPLMPSARYADMPASKTYRGTVLNPFNWIGPDDFCLSTDIAESPVRILDSKLILNLRHLDGTEAAVDVPTNKPKVRVWTIEGSKGNVYTVTLNGDKFVCDCVAGKFGRHCKHVDQAKKDL